MSDKLKELLSRARERIASAQKDTLRARAASDAEALAQDYARRLEERARFRRLLADDDLDGMRFRWYQKHFCQGDSLDSFRAWIDSQMAAEVQKSAQAS